MKKNVLLTYLFSLIEEEPGKADGNHLNTNIQMEEGNFHFGNVQWPLVDTAIGLDHDLNSVDMLARNELDATGQEPHNLVEVSTQIDVEQEPSKQSYSNIFITALHLNKLKKNFWDRGRERT